MLPLLIFLFDDTILILELLLLLLGFNSERSLLSSSSEWLLFSGYSFRGTVSALANGSSDLEVNSPSKYSEELAVGLQVSKEIFAGEDIPKNKK